MWCCDVGMVTKLYQKSVSRRRDSSLHLDACAIDAQGGRRAPQTSWTTYVPSVRPRVPGDGRAPHDRRCRRPLVGLWRSGWCRTRATGAASPAGLATIGHRASSSAPRWSWSSTPASGCSGRGREAVSRRSCRRARRGALRAGHGAAARALRVALTRIHVVRSQR